MSIYAEMHDGTRLEFPDGTSPDVMQTVVKRQLAGQPHPAIQDGLSADHPLQTTYQATPQKLSLLDRFKQQQEQGKQQRAEAIGSLASAPINAYLGAKQLVTGSLDPIEQDVLRQNKEAEAKDPLGALVSNIAMVAAAPATSIPRVVAQGAAYTALQPTDKQGVEGYQQRGIEALKGGLAGAAGSYGNVAGTALKQSAQGLDLAGTGLGYGAPALALALRQPTTTTPYTAPGVDPNWAGSGL